MQPRTHDHQNFGSTTGDAIAGVQPIVRPPALVKADSAAFILFEKPDLDRAEAFLKDFGLVRTERGDGALWMRGYGPEPFIYQARKGAKSRFVGFALNLRSDQTVEAAGQALNAPIRSLEGPGGGRAVALTDPNGFEIWLVGGRTLLEELPTRRALFAVNTPEHKARVNETVRPESGPTPVKRFAHLVIRTPHFDESLQWYMRHVGAIPTDVFCLEGGQPNMAFLRLDRGEEPADHHTIVLFGAPGPPGYGHSAYETIDIDAIGQGQQWLKERGWTHHWGIGRHIYGSQFFDYWRDPWGDEVEHYADGDVFNASFPTRYHALDRAGLWLWGDDLPASMRPRLRLGEVLAMTWAGLTGRVDLGWVKRLTAAMNQPPRPWLK